MLAMMRRHERPAPATPTTQVMFGPTTEKRRNSTRTTMEKQWQVRHRERKKRPRKQRDACFKNARVRSTSAIQPQAKGVQ